MSRAASTQRDAIAGLVVHLRSEGVRQVDIATRLGISQSHVSRILEKAGARRPAVARGPFEDHARQDRNVLIARLRTEGMTLV